MSLFLFDDCSLVYRLVQNFLNGFHLEADLKRKRRDLQLPGSRGADGAAERHLPTFGFEAEWNSSATVIPEKYGC